MLERYKYVLGVASIVLLLLPVAPRARPRGQRRPALGQGRPAAVPARRAGEDLPDRLPRRVPARQARGARAGPAQGLRAAARDLGRGDARARPDERPRLGAPHLRDLPRDALRGDGPRALRRRRARSSSPAARGALQRARPRAGARARLAPSLDGRARALHPHRQARLPPELRLVPAREEPLLDRERRLRRHRASAAARSRRSTAST